MMTKLYYWWVSLKWSW